MGSISNRVNNKNKNFFKNKKTKGKALARSPAQVLEERVTPGCVSGPELALTCCRVRPGEEEPGW